MTEIREDLARDGSGVVRLESDFLAVEVAPEVGGRVISLVEKNTGREFLWRNPALPLRRMPPGSEYDPNFYGGIDELLPNDMPETIHGIACPDHGELWTAALDWAIAGSALELQGNLPRFGLTYYRQMSLRPDGPFLDLKFRISNATDQPRNFLWKLHAALAVRAGDIIDCPARQAQVVDPAWSRYKTLAPFTWPRLEGNPVNIVPPLNGTMDFFYLFDLRARELALRSQAQGVKFAYRFDTRIFPYAWLFASYGGFNGHYTVILEPCTSMPISVNEAAARNQCSMLQPGQMIETSVSIYAGPAAD